MKNSATESDQDAKIQQNITNWQTSNDPLAPLTDQQLDIIYEISDLVKDLYVGNDQSENASKKQQSDHAMLINSNRAYIKWLISIEDEIKYENLAKYQKYDDILTQHKLNCQHLYDCSSSTIDSLQDLKAKYENVTSKTNYLHDLSEQLMANQRILKEKKQQLNERLKYFVQFNKIQENIERYNTKINTNSYLELLNSIDEAVCYLDEHINFKESRIHKMKYDSLLTTALNKIYNYVNNIIVETTKQVLDPEIKTNLFNTSDNSIDATFSLYYGKFQSAATKVANVLQHLEQKTHMEAYNNVLIDCQKVYFSQRQPILSVAVSKALSELKDKHKNDHSILFRSCCLFTMKVCQDEARCYNYFFDNTSNQLNDYLGSLCQNLYDTLRPNLITINHVEVLSELCGILKKEMLNDKILENDQFVKYTEIVKQLLQDVEERLVFRTNVFFQYDLMGYKPSPGDLAYPEKLQHMENIAVELKDFRTDSRSSIVSLESQEVAQINANHQITPFRSYTGNSPADLHGMWYPTVKRTLVCLSRLYFCLDRDIFQGLAQEALVICVKTIEMAANLISEKRTPIDGKLFQIKHLLIIREQIAPFQVDFTVKEMTLDFSNVQKAALDFIQKRNNLFKFGSNNALLEFLLDGTPKVREYLVDSRKEIDKQLKLTCESFINHVTYYLIGNLLDWLEKFMKLEKKQDATDVENNVKNPQLLGQLINDVKKNLKLKIPEVQRSMQLYLANRETEFILFRPIKNNILNAFIQVDQVLTNGGFTMDDQLLVALPSPEQVNILICSVSLSSEQEIVATNVTN